MLMPRLRQTTLDRATLRRPTRLRASLLPLALLVGAVAAAAPAAQAVQAAQSEDLQVNTYTTGDQLSPSVAASNNGSFLVVWQSTGSAGSDTSSSIQARRLDRNNEPQGDQFQVNSYTTGYQRYPSVAATSDGGFLVVWYSSGSPGTDTSYTSIQGRRFTAQGVAIGNDFQVNYLTTGLQFNPTVASSSDGHFLVVWETSYPAKVVAPNGPSLNGRVLDQNAMPIGSEFQVFSENISNPLFDFYPSVAEGSTDEFLIVWGNRNGENIQGRRVTTAGGGGGAGPISSYTTGLRALPSVAGHPDGVWLVAWESNPSPGDDGDSASINARRMDANGGLGTDFQVNSYTTGNQLAPAVDGDADGEFLVVWQSSGSPGDDNAADSVQGQRLAADGAPIGGQFQVNTYTTSDQGRPAVAFLPEGDFLVAWQSDGSGGDDSSQSSIQARSFRVTADVGDRVWRDTDGDGLQDGGEPGVPGVLVHLYDRLGDVRGSTTTDGDGLFRVYPRPGTWYLEFEPPAPFLFTAERAGSDDDLDSDADPVSGQTGDIVVQTGEVELMWDAGLVLPTSIFSDGFESGDTSAWQ